MDRGGRRTGGLSEEADRWAQVETMAPRSTTTAWDFAAVCAQIEAGTPARLVENRRVLAVTPDPTRTAPMPLLVRAVQEVIGSRAARLDYMVALGTHPVMSEQGILDLYGVSAADKERDFPGSRFLNHRWDPGRHAGPDRPLRGS